MLFAALGIFVAAAFLVFQWYSRRSKQKADLPRTLDTRQPELWSSFRPLLRQAAAYSQHVPLLGLKERYARMIEKAGLRFEMTADEFLGLKVGALVVMAGAGLVVQLMMIQSWLVVFMFVFLGAVYPDIALSSAVNRQQQKFLRSLPDFLDLLALSVEAGMGFDSAVRRLTEVLEPGPLVWRFQTFLRSMNVGKTRVEALKEMSQKVDLPDFTSFVNVVVQATETGASMGPVLRTASADMLSRRFERAEKTAHELPVKILLPLFVFVFPATFIMVLGPVYFQFQASGAAGAL